MSNVGKLIRNGRKSSNLTQTDLALILGVAPITVHRWEKGQMGRISARAFAPQLEKKLGLERGSVVKSVNNR